MKRKILIGLICVCVSLCYFCGCTEQKGNTKPLFLTAQGLLEDRQISVNYTGGAFHTTINYQSYTPGDTMRIKDTISDIDVSNNITSITFAVNYTYPMTNVTRTTLIFNFNGNITNTYATGDTVEINLTVFHTTYTNVTFGSSIDIEVFEEGWNQSYFEQQLFSFNTDFFYQIFPADTISKAE